MSKTLCPMALLVPFFLLFFTRPAHACPACINEMLCLAIPFMKNWLILFTVWLAWALVVKLITHTLTNKDVLGTVKMAGLLAVAFAFCLGPIVFLGLSIYWLIWYFTTAISCLKPGNTNTSDRPLALMSSILLLSLLWTAFTDINEASAGGIRYRMSRLVVSGAASGLRSEIARKGLLSDRELINLAFKGDRNQRYNAIEIMGMKKKGIFVPPLIEIMKKDSGQRENNRTRAIFVLENITGQGFGTDVAKWEAWWAANSKNWVDPEQK
jgi:hypothetical protein